MNLQRYMKQAKRLDNGEVVQGFLFYMKYDICEIECIGIEPLSANNYSEIYSSCYYEVDLETIEDIPVKPNESAFIGISGICPTCSASQLSKRNYCYHCGQRLSWGELE